MLISPLYMPRQVIGINLEFSESPLREVPRVEKETDRACVAAKIVDSHVVLAGST